MTGCILHESAQAYGCAACDARAKWLHANGAHRCTCGSGAHPRHCSVHPLGYVQHCEDLDADTLFDDDAFQRGAAVAFGLMGMAEAIRRNYMSVLPVVLVRHTYGTITFPTCNCEPNTVHTC